ncbi:hypothetical protein BBJ28_00006230 [Nothophytophthora sp. Chile5]|nr:hypothetical protein BBJ28_00006230 [Nothophytophthora sp. Chile5]
MPEAATAMADDGILVCLLCEQLMPAAPTERCLTDCSHEFCLSCMCRQLAVRKNRCPACHSHIKKVHQLLETSPSSAPETPKPAFVRYCNATYVLNVSIWAVDDPARVLASLFNL